jgi:hypothetical protein
MDASCRLQLRECEITLVSGSISRYRDGVLSPSRDSVEGDAVFNPVEDPAIP